MGKVDMATASTDLGYVNRHDQMVLRKLDRTGSDQVRMGYVLRCLECEHEYETTGADTPVCHCPACDSGLPELARAA
jgi:rubrerythrin